MAKIVQLKMATDSTLDISAFHVDMKSTGATLPTFFWYVFMSSFRLVYLRVQFSMLDF